MDDEANAVYNKRKALATLERLQWLADNGCKFSFDISAAIAELREAAPEWRPAYASHAAESRETRGGFVAINKQCDSLLAEPLDRVLRKAQELSGRTDGNILEERDPFAGLCENFPVRAFRALTHAARHDDYPEWAWRTFFSSSRRDNDKPRLSAAIADRVCRLPDDVLVKLLYPSTWWLQRAGKSLSNEYPKVFDAVTTTFIELLRQHPGESGSAIIGSSGARDWVTDALNSPVGHIAIALLEDSRLKLVDGIVEAPPNRLAQLSRLLTLDGGSRRHAIAITVHHLDWLYRLDPKWTESHLLSILDADDRDDSDALLAGVFWNPRITSPHLYQRLKPAFVAMGKQANARGTHLQVLAYLTLLGWVQIDEKKKERDITNAELRDLILHAGDDFRSHILWQIQHALSAGDESTRRQWLVSALEFFEDVWPREKAVKTAAMSARLCDVLLSNAEGFRKLLDVVLPFLTKIVRGVDLHWRLRNDAADIIQIHAEGLLTLLYAVLPDNASEWPYGIGDIIEKLGANDSTVRSDPRLEELKRRWKSM